MLKTAGILLTPTVMIGNSLLGTELDRLGHLVVPLAALGLYCAGLLRERQAEAVEDAA